VTRIEDIMPAMKEAFHLAKSGRPGPVLVDITKDAQQAKMDFAWDATPVQMRGYRPAPAMGRAIC
jgi:acetolactate synthase-1/2/3 large subunit